MNKFNRTLVIQMSQVYRNSGVHDKADKLDEVLDTMQKVEINTGILRETIHRRATKTTIEAARRNVKHFKELLEQLEEEYLLMD